MAAINIHDVGDRVRIAVEFRNLDGALADPSTVTVKHQDPSGNETSSTSSWTKDGTGRYHLDVDIDESGTWYYRWAGTGDLVAAGEGSFIVRPTQFG